MQFEVQIIILLLLSYIMKIFSIPIIVINKFDKKKLILNLLKDKYKSIIVSDLLLF